MSEIDGSERARMLMMAVLDGESTPEERTELDTLLARDARLREEYENMTVVKKVTGSIGFREPPPEIWDDYWASVYNRLERGVGWILVSLGAVVLLGWGCWEFVQGILHDETIPTFAKIATFSVLLGFSVLLVSVARERLFTHRDDPYKEIER